MTVALRLGSTARLPLKFWQAKPLDGSPRQRLAFDSVTILRENLPSGIEVSLLAAANATSDGTLFFDATNDLASEADTARVYSVELKTVAGADHTVWPAIAIELLP
jgi:hypothetical protein